MLAAFPAPLYR